MNRAVKIRIYPDKEQSVQIEKTIGCSRFIYNQMLADKISYYQKEKKMLRNTPAGYKKEYPWLKEVDSLAWRMRSCIWNVRSGSFSGNHPADFPAINQENIQEILIQPMQ